MHAFDHLEALERLLALLTLGVSRFSGQIFDKLVHVDFDEQLADCLGANFSAEDFTELQVKIAVLGLGKQSEASQGLELGLGVGTAGVQLFEFLGLGFGQGTNIRLGLAGAGIVGFNDFVTAAVKLAFEVGQSTLALLVVDAGHDVVGEINHALKVADTHVEDQAD